MLIHASSIDRLTAKAPRPAIGRLRWHPAALVPHGAFPRGPGALAPVFVEVGLRAPREVISPGGLEIGARLFEGFGRAADLPPVVRRRVKTAVPTPWSTSTGTPVRIAIVPTCTSPK